MTTADKLNKLLLTKQEIKNAIESKGVNVGDAPFAEYADKVRTLAVAELNVREGLVEYEEGNLIMNVTKYTTSSKEFGWQNYNAGNYSNMNLRGKLTIIDHGGSLSALSNLDYNNISEVVIPEYIKVIDSRAFYYNNLTSIILPKSIIGIGVDAFTHNRNLTDIYIYRDDPSQEISGAPWGANNATIHYLQAEDDE